MLLLAAPLGAEPLRLAYFHSELERDGPGLLLRDILRDEDAQVAAVLAVIEAAEADVLVLSGVDWDAGGLALAALNAALARPYPHLFTARPNAGRPTGRDLDGNGRLAEARDAQGYGRFTGAGGMGVLSRYGFSTVQDFSSLLWEDLPGNLMPDGDPGLGVQRLSSMVHWVLPVEVRGRRLHLGIFHATPPVFDGPEDRNGRRNHDEILFWVRLLDGALPGALPDPFVILGGANLDGDRSEGRRAAIRALLQDRRLQETRPMRPGRAEVPLATVDWPAPGPGQMRVDYLLPSAGLKVIDSGVLWPEGEAPLARQVAQASRHRLIWLDLRWP
ncbi:Endonuclease/Exonuclease/phosphatase family protein [Pseudooceanicola antarcticus]|uniref:Endonuclease/Exonuclease/phosphatase family protein n=1 Tax=Pseudooceanicola antarcticus TaxID=1247613 RepID=A0A285I1P6_9RHOB|nr:endonuclease/exonuclease/phosphatase family protein [Pseudooceanicola antarcticus]SNY41797.1 Endonuclease/Exonuclease/phosphatase family protein [Pseudooceanicola antarcticus]